MKAKRTYDVEALKLAQAIDLAISAFQQYPLPEWEHHHVTHLVKCYSDWKYSALNPTFPFKTLKSLDYVIQDVFTPFQEGTGEAVEYFWEQVTKENLGYVREDKLRKIITRGRIKNRAEYEYVIDLLVVAQQEGRINAVEASALSEIIGQFERRGA